MPKWTAEQTQAIYEKGKNIIVSAGAGSGKTAVLSERVLEHVKSGIDIDDLLILTFTNAAAAEMKERIRKKLQDSPMLKAQADKVDMAYITTFDAFALSLVKKHGYLLNMPSKVAVIDDSILKLKKREILTEIFENYYANKDELFEKLINDFCLKDDKEVFEGILKLCDKLDNLYDKRGFLENYVDNYYQDENILKFTYEYNELLRRKIKAIKGNLDYLSSYTDYSYIEKLEDVLGPLLGSKEYAEIKHNIPDKLPSAPRGSSLEAKNIKAEIASLVKELKNLTSYEDTSEIKRSLYLTRDYAEIIVKILLEFDLKIQNYKRDNDSYEFVDIAKMAIRILENFEDVKLELKGKYKEILIDEYQDTNDLQDLFVSFLEDNNVYMVGDIKQSIYRFRNANPLLFKKKYDSYSKGLDGFKIDLNKNFRSRSEVTNGINVIFNLVMNDEIGGADYLTSHQLVFGNTAYNEVNNEDYKMEVLNYVMPESKEFSKEEIEIFTIARDIEEKVKNHYKIMDKETSKERDITYGDFAILMDRSRLFDTYKKVFEYLNIPLSIYKDKTISNSVDILLIKNLYTIIFGIKDKCLDAAFKYAFMSILRSYLYRMPDKDIFKIITENKFKDTEVYDKCFKIALDLEVLTNEEVYLRIIKDFNFYENMIKAGDMREHMITLEAIGKIVQNVSNLGYSPRKFLEYLKETIDSQLDIKLSVNKDDSNAVKIMTIHTSKGLEYPICYFSGLYKKFNIDDLKSKFYYSKDYGLVMPYMAGSLQNSILKTLLKESYLHEEISEKLRLFYVALTRAREKIIMVTSLDFDTLSFKDNGVINDEIRLKYLSFNDILNSVVSVLKPYVKMVDINKLNLTKDYNLTRKKDFRKSLEVGEKLTVIDYVPSVVVKGAERFSKNTHELYDKDVKSNIDFGNEMHKLLEEMDFVNPDYTGLTDYQAGIIKAFINSGILDGSINLYKEHEFMYQTTDNIYHGFIDLLIEYPDKFRIIDYKLKNVVDEAYVKQLNGYKEYVMMMSDKPVEMYLYSLLDKELVKVD